MMMFSLLCTACKADDNTMFLGENIENKDFFITPEESFVGDPMPFYDNGKFYVYFLDDLRDGQKGYHPWSLFITDDLYEYEYKKQVINFANSDNEQDIALGTGSVIKDKNGLYHAFYTGHNDKLRDNEPKEAIMHATSTDLINWTKIPADTFNGKDKYSDIDFRDPYVIYVDDEDRYWMLITTRKNNMGVIVKYTSKDLVNWTDEGVFFTNDMGNDSNLECPSLVKFNDKFYLFFSDQSSERVVHYRIADNINGNFIKPENDIFDGNGFYAGRVETDGENLYIFGWNATKELYMDDQKYNWGGNLVVHQLIQNNDGTLYPAPVENIINNLYNQIKFDEISISDGVQKQKNSYLFSNSSKNIVTFKPLSGNYVIEGEFSDYTNGKFGFTFDLNDEFLGELNLVFNTEKNTLEFFNTYDINSQPQTSINYQLNLDAIKFKILISDTVMSVYIDNSCVLTCRMYDIQETNWGIFSINTSVKLDALKIYK